MVGKLISVIGLGAGTILAVGKINEEIKRLEELNKILGKIDRLHMKYSKILNINMKNGANINETNIEEARKTIKELEKAWAEAAEVVKKKKR